MIYSTVFRQNISIHALRVEGDRYNADRMGLTTDISIHALRVEGDRGHLMSSNRGDHFYPRPPGGGRLGDGSTLILS